MNSRTIEAFDQIDHATCRTICNAIGERLRQNFRPETSALSSELQHLMDQLRKREDENPSHN